MSKFILIQQKVIKVRFDFAESDMQQKTAKLISLQTNDNGDIIFILFLTESSLCSISGGIPCSVAVQEVQVVFPCLEGDCVRLC
jgi:hypothetical protein